MLFFTKSIKKLLGTCVVLLSCHMAMGQATVPASSFYVTDTIGCNPLQVSFQPAVSGSKYYWEFGNGNTSTLANPSNVYTSPGQYTVKLTVTNSGKTLTYTEKNVIRVVNNPVAAFDCVNRSACPGTDIAFSNSSQNSKSYIWDFGDGNTSTAESPVHAYKVSGTYTVKMIASNAFGCRDVAVKTAFITIFSKPVPAFSADRNNACDSTITFSFKNNSTNSVKYLWSFGDGSFSSSQSPQHIYNRTGVFTVRLYVTSSQGCTDSLVQPAFINIGKLQKPDFTANNQAACQQSVVRFSTPDSASTGWQWDFGDGTTSTQAKPIHTYTRSGSYTVSLIVTSNGGCSQQVVKKDYITVKGFINASFTGGGAGCAPYHSYFTNLSTGTTSWLWEFGDGTTSSLKNPSHSYTKPGTYSVTLHAFGASGCERIYELNNNVKVYGKPVLSVQASKTQGCPPFLTQFTVDTTGLSRWKLDFGDTTTSIQPNPSHTYVHEGTYTVRLIAYNKTGCADTLTRQSYITVANPKVNYAASSPLTGCVPFSTNFTDATTDHISWFWDFGDGTTATTQDAPHTYTKAGIYNVRLVTKNSGGCTETINHYASIDLSNNNLLPDFNSQLSKCPYGVNFKDSTAGATSWFWDFGDGSTGTGPAARHVYSKKGVYTVTLTVKTAQGCTKTISKKVQGNEILSGNITPGQVDPVFPVTVNFRSNSVGATRWHWDFGDGDTSNLADPSHYYKDSADYKVTLTITDGKCVMVYIAYPFHKVDEHPNNLPPQALKAAFGSSVSSGCAPLTVNFKNTSQLASNYLWRFGDGTTSTAKDPLHTYTKAGKYTVTLIVRDNTLNYDSIVSTDYIIASKPQSDFVTHQYISKNSYTVVFTDSSIDATNWSWNFGDGSNSRQQNTTHAFDMGKSYPVSLSISNDGGCANTSTKIINSTYTDVFKTDYAKACVGQKLQFGSIFNSYKKISWDFGDGNTSLLPAPEYTYSKRGTYMIKVTITDNQGSEYTYSAPDSIVVSDPKAIFSVNGPTVHCDSLNVSFNNSSIDASEYLWDFGDGNTSTEKEPAHNYNKPGVYTVGLTAFKNGCSDIHVAANLITINAAKPDFAFTQSAVCLPITATFTDRSVNARSWFWDFGDGATSTLQNPVHTYTRLPQRAVSLSIVDNHGCGGTVRKNIGLIKAQFDVNMTSGCGPLSIVFKDMSDYASSWKWSFGDGTTSTSQNPVHLYTQDGYYTVRLVVRSATGCIDSMVRTNYIHVSKPVAAFFSPDKANCAPSYVTFKDQSKSAVSWFWDFGDSSYSYNNNPAHIYNRPGKYTVKLLVKNANGCTDTMVKKDYVKVLGPITAMSASASKACPGTEISFTDHSIDAVAWDWNFGDGSTSHSRNPKHAFTDPGSYTVTLITHDTFGCTSLATLSPQIKIFDKVPPVACPIRRVTVNSNSAVQIDWSPSNADDFSSYQLFRLDNESNQYRLIATIKDISTLSYIDNNLNTLNNSYTYKLQTYDFCGYAVSLDSLTAHTTVNVTATVQKANINLSWTAYRGCSVSGYSIMRMVPGSKEVSLIATVPAGQLRYTDTTWTCPVPYSYRIVANNICGDSLVSLSDTAIATPQNLFKDQKVDVVRSTVVDNRSVLTEWKAPAVLPGKVSAYRLYRSLNGVDYKFLTTVSADETSYMDNDVDVSKQSYYYKIEPANNCDIQAKQGLHGSSIVLGVRTYDEKIQLDWTGYDGWQKGVGYYVIEKMNSEGAWEKVGKVDGKRTTFEDEQH